MRTIDAVSVPTEDRQIGKRKRLTVQTYAKAAGVLGLVSLVAGGLGEFYIPSMIIVSSDTAATARNIIGSNLLFRIGFAAYLVEATCDVMLSLVLYVLLKPVHKNIALLATFFRLVNTTLYGMAEFFYIAPLLILGGAEYLKTFSPDQLNALALLSLNLYRYEAAIFTVFSAAGYIIQGYLIYRSGYLPRFLGVLMSLAGVGFAMSSFTLLLAPAYTFFGYLVLVVIAGVSLTSWMLAKGVDVRKWEERTQTSG